MAVTAPTGDIGRSLVRALEPSRAVGRIVGMGRRPYDPASVGLKKTDYLPGDVLGSTALERLVDGADVVVHRGRPPGGTDGHYSSAQKAELEGTLRDVLDGTSTEACVFRPSIVGGSDALALIQNIPYVTLSEKMPAAVLRALELLPALKPVIPDPGVPFQLVHHDDVATALRAAVLGRGAPGIYNLAAAGTLTLSDLTDALGWYSVPLPELAVDAAAEVVARLPFVRSEAQWIEALRESALMDTTKARRELRWRPRHNARETLREIVDTARSERLIR